MSIIVRQHCDCPMDPYHRWNCDLTPLWARTIRDLDTNPWTAIEQYRAYGDLKFLPIRINQWDGMPESFCGRGPCCLGDGHSGRCRM